jgi:hypothetical protein
MAAVVWLVIRNGNDDEVVDDDYVDDAGDDDFVDQVDNQQW